MPSRARGKARTNTKAEIARLRTALLNVEDEVSRLASLYHLGNLAAEGIHGLARTNPDATAMAFYFMALRQDLDRVKGMCKSAR